jgi:hypothetical protein
MTQEEVIVTAIAFVVGLIFKRPAIIQAALERLMRKK